MALVPDGLDAEETQKFNKEFDAYQEKLKEQKETWAKEHPDQAKKSEDYDMDGFFEDDSTRELKQIFQGQSAINEVRFCWGQCQCTYIWVNFLNRYNLGD